MSGTEWYAARCGKGWLVHMGDTYIPIADKATAHRIAAVNEMEAALEKLLKEVEASGNAEATDYNWPSAVADSRTALAKARGDQ